MAGYKFGNRIGSGGFGVVVEATRISDNLKCVAKKLSDEDNASQEDKDRFIREVRICRSLNHPRIISILGARMTAAPLFYTMPAYRGNCRQIIDEIRADLTLQSKILFQLLDGIEFAHANGVIHRDLKPENILYDDDRNIVISDFGLGRILNSESQRNTQSGQGFGTYFYAAPEQLADAKRADIRADIYSIGQIIYEFNCDYILGTHQDIRAVGAGVQHIVRKCTQPNPDARYQSIAELRADIQIIMPEPNSEAAEPVSDIKETLAEIYRLHGTSQEAIARLQAIVLAALADNDAIHELVMSIPIELLSNYHEQWTDMFVELVDKFLIGIEGESWPFNYCDTIANRLKALLPISDDVSLKGRIVKTMFDLGLSHNRFFVMSETRNILEKITDNGEALGISDALKNYGSELMKLFGGDVHVLAVPLRALAKK